MVASDAVVSAVAVAGSAVVVAGAVVVVESIRSGTSNSPKYRYELLAMTVSTPVAAAVPPETRWNLRSGKIATESRTECVKSR